jgi:hypothetical protein
MRALRFLALAVLIFSIPECAHAAIPAYREKGALAIGTTTSAPVLPVGHTTNDILVLLVESDDSATVAEDQGYTNLGETICGTTSGLTIFIKRHDGSESNPAVSGCVDHCQARIAAYSGVTTGADYYQLGGATTQTTAAVAYSAITTETADALVLLITGLDDNANDLTNMSAYTNANLSSITARWDETETTGNGGGHALADGGNATADNIGASSATHDSLVCAISLHLALYSIEPSAPTCTAGLNLPLLGVGGCP